jgi:hypothetical protein
MNTALMNPINDVSTLGSALNTSQFGFIYVGNVSTNNYLLGGALIGDSTRPTISSGFCSSPYTQGSAGSMAFQVQVGTSCSVAVGVLSMPYNATTSWSCTGYSSYQADTIVFNFANGGSMSLITIVAYSRTTGARLNFISGDVISVSCMSY